MLERFRSLFTKRNAAALALMAAVAAAAAGWKLGSGEAIGRYLAAPVTRATIEENVTAVGTDGALKPQMSAQTFFVVARAENALAVPVAALQPVGGNRSGGGGTRARQSGTEGEG